MLKILIRLKFDQVNSFDKSQLCSLWFDLIALMYMIYDFEIIVSLELLILLDRQLCVSTTALNRFIMEAESTHHDTDQTSMLLNSPSSRKYEYHSHLLHEVNCWHQINNRYQLPNLIWLKIRCMPERNWLHQRIIICSTEIFI